MAAVRRRGHRGSVGRPGDARGHRRAKRRRRSERTLYLHGKADDDRGAAQRAEDDGGASSSGTPASGDPLSSVAFPGRRLSTFSMGVNRGNKVGESSPCGSRPAPVTTGISRPHGAE